MIRFSAALLISIITVVAPCSAQSPLNKTPSETHSASAPESPLPDPLTLGFLIKTTLIALNQANATGNYSVVRDLAAPGFQSANTQAQLAETFSSIRRRNIDLSPILVFEPKFVRTPAIQANGQLRLSGYFETRPEQVSFDLAFEKCPRSWCLFGIALEVAPAKPDSGQPGASAPAASEQTDTKTVDAASPKETKKTEKESPVGAKSTNSKPASKAQKQ